MRLSILKILVLSLSGIYGLKPHQFPNGNLVKFSPNLYKPRNDLIYLEPSKAAIISTNWMTNIMHHNSYNFQKKTTVEDFKSKNMINYEELNKVADITDFLNKKIIHEDKMLDESSFLLGWSPTGNHGRNEILFIIYNKLDYLENKLIRSQLIQSPFWSPAAIKSEYLKKSLENLSNELGFDLCLEELFIKDLRFRLAWSTWNLDSEEIKIEDFPEDGEVGW